MNSRRVLEIGGIIAGVLMIAFGIGALVMSINARNTVSDEIKAEQIVGSADMNPTAIAAAVEEAGLTESTRCPRATSPSSRSRPAPTPAASPSTFASTRSSRRVA